MHDSPLKFIGQLGGLYSAGDDKFLRSTEILFHAAALETNRQFESIGVAELQARSAAKCRKEKPVVLPLDGLFPHLHARRRQTNKTPYLHARNYRQGPNGPALEFTCLCSAIPRALPGPSSHGLHLKLLTEFWQWLLAACWLACPH